jgi:hypothetical protein
LVKVKLNPFACPTCKDGMLVYVEVEELTIKRAKRFPTIVTAKCSRNHALVVFVDANFQVRDVEPSAVATEEQKDAVDKTKGWFESF